MPDREAAIGAFSGILDGFGPLYQAEWLARFGAKLGLAQPTEDDRPLIEALMALMAQGGSDFTLSFRALGTAAARDHIADRDALAAWEARWLARAPDAALMARANPAVIPRTHRIEQVIAAGVAGDFAPFAAMLAAVTDPFTPAAPWTDPPAEAERVTRTFCGT
jgi:uncharacterized protein YdiU (UPF0061 family)